MKRIIAEPEFCPNKDCRFHDRACAREHQWYILFGTLDTLCRGTIHSTNDSRDEAGRFGPRECNPVSNPARKTRDARESRL